MMKTFRTLTKNFAFKLVLGIVALSFVFFGISSFVLGGSSNWVAKIGGKTISYSTLQRSMKENKEMILKAYGNNEQALAYLDSEQFVGDSLNRIINQQMVKNLTNEFGVSGSEKLILENIAKDKNFADDQGKFDNEKFKKFLTQNGINEDVYVSEMINQASMMMIAQTLEISAPVSSQKIIDIINFNEERRAVDLISINENNLKSNEAVSQDEIKKYYQDHKKEFILPETRRISYLKFTPQSLNLNAEISEEDISKEYQKNKSLYISDETRNFYHLIFDQESQAKEFISKLNDNTKNDPKKLANEFVKLAKEINKKDLKAITLNNASRQKLFEKTAEKAFNLKPNELSSPIKSSLGYHVFLLNQINPSKTLELSEARDIIKQKLQENIKENQLALKITNYDSSLKKVKDLNEFLTTNKLTNSLQDAIITKEKNDANVQNIFQGNSEEITKIVFDLKKNQVSKLIAVDNGNFYYAIQLNEIIESKPEELSNVSKAIESKLLADKKQQALTNFAQEIANELTKDPENIAKTIAKYQLKIERNRIMPRTFVINYQGRQIPYRSPLLDKIFSIKLNQTTGAVSESGGYAIAILRDIKKPEISKELVEQVAKSAQQMFRSDIMQQFNNYLMTKYPVKVNEKILGKNQQN